MELENTLEDGAWKDSFDKLLDIKPVLRELNILKKDVRASFNNDSSVENSRNLSLSLAVPEITPTKLPTKVSTPLRNPVRQPFKCSISPITQWQLNWVKLKKKTKKMPLRNRVLQSTVIRPEVVVIDYDDENDKTKETSLQIATKDPIIDEILRPRRTSKKVNDENSTTKEPSQKLTSKDTTLRDLLRPRKSSKKVLGIRQVLFDSNIRRQSIQTSVELQKSQDQTKIRHSQRRTTTAARKCIEKRKSQPDLDTITTTTTTTTTKQRLSNKRPSHEKNKRKSPTDMTLHPGKWRKSLSFLRRSQVTQAQERNAFVRLEAIVDCDESVEFIDIVPASKFVGKRKTLIVKLEDADDSDDLVYVENPKDRVLQYCHQNQPELFDKMYDIEKMSDCCKIGEGVYGEVFLNRVKDEQVVCKIIPIEGSLRINGELQKTYEHILPEIVISNELCNLRKLECENATSGFVEIKKVSCIQGKYPTHLIKHWEAYDNEKGSENDHPGDFPETQIYIVLELEFAGKDLESFLFNNAEQSFAALKQIVLTLAVAEKSLEFEHRDLHWGNVLIRPTNDSELTYKIHDKTLTMPTLGIKATIIDYTLSRMKYKDHCYYNDLSNDEELFTATGDYQFDMYRMMRDILGNNWERFEPKTNVFWISYIIAKMVNGVKYENIRSKGHTQYLRKMRALKNDVLEYSSACDFVECLQSV